MSEFQFKTAIPTHSDARGLLSAGDTYFSSNTHLFTLRNGKYSHVSSAEGTIRAFGVTGEYSLLCTSDRVYLNNRSSLIGSLRRSASAIDVHGGIFAIAVGNILEVWKIPVEYKFTLFTQHSKNVGHYKTIRQIKIISPAEILTASDDCTVRLFNIEERTTKIIASLSDVPRGLHYDAAGEAVVVTCANGSVTQVSLRTMEYTGLKLEGSILASASVGNVWAVCHKKSISGVSDTKPNGKAIEAVSDIRFNDKAVSDIRFNDKAVGDKATSDKLATNEITVMIIFKDMEEIYRGELEQKVIEMAMDRNSIVIRTNDSIESYNIHSQSFEFHLDLPRILSISLLKNTIAAACRDRKVRVYRGLGCTAVLADANAKGDIIGVHLTPSTCVAVYSTGHLSSFNVSDGHCFRSFQISDDILGVLSCSCMSEDGCLLYVSEQASIQVVDVVRSKLVDTINLKSPVISMAFHKGFLYTVELDKTLSKINVFSGHIVSGVVENTPTSLAVRDQRVLVSTVMDVVVYDLDISFLSSFQVRLEGRRRDEMFSKGKAVEQIEFNAKYIFCGGAANQIKVFEQHGDEALMRSFLLQTLRVSGNKEWENYKTKLLHERDDKVDKERVIGAVKICADERRLYVLGTDGLSVYEKGELGFSPLEFDVVASEEYVREAVRKGSEHKGLMGAMRMGSAELIRSVIEGSKDVDFLVRHIPREYAGVLVEMLVEWVKGDFRRIEYIGMISRLVRWHGISRPGLWREIEEGTKRIYEEVKKNKYLIDVIFDN